MAKLIFNFDLRDSTIGTSLDVIMLTQDYAVRFAFRECGLGWPGVRSVSQFPMG